jgi:hypothetical protein
MNCKSSPHKINITPEDGHPASDHQMIAGIQDFKRKNQAFAHEIQPKDSTILWRARHVIKVNGKQFLFYFSKVIT